MKKTKILTGLLTLSMISSTAMTALNAQDNRSSFNNTMHEIANYNTNAGADGDGGVAEIVKYNKYNQTMYLVSGKTQSVHIVNLNNVNSNSNTTLEATKTVTLESIGINDAGDITSVDVSPDGKEIAIAIQHKDYDKNGYIARFDANGQLINIHEAGIQPDMITYSPDGSLILTANEGEPRQGYEAGTVDPKGSITALDTNTNQSYDIDFTAFDNAESRAALVADNVIIKKDTAPSVDFEPEYITISNDSLTAYVTLQEANSIATIDLTTKQVTRVDSLGFKDYSSGDNKVDLYKKDDAINITNTDEFLGIYMPDGISSYEVDGKTYLLTANEGDSREWGDYINEVEEKYGESESKIVTLNTDDYDGFDDLSKKYLFGGRSFSIIDASTMTMVSDSNGEFEEITAKLLPEYFNCSNDDISFEDRSGKKGPEPEDIKTMIIDGKVMAFIGLERIGGVMMYDVSDPTNPTYVDYLNLRDFSDDISGSVSPEGLCTVSAKDSPTNKPMLIIANEVSGDVNVVKVAGETYQHSLTLDKTEITLKPGENQTLNVTYDGYKTLTFSSDNNNVVNINNNVITAINPGVATITVSDGQIQATCKVTVTNPDNSQTGTQTPSTPDQNVSSQEKQPANTAVKTGDESNLGLYTAVSFLAIGLIIELVRRRQKSH
ncbi:MAG TPA: choice-of-anchor I family protein [Candidatus Erysipelatoclostridium merdavium]|uniref:Choice-of-anchor I family protein n=1 Tax=Candidatus Erysipelatoclostridium merdavium TaxID=2838566 RepID=A0A9D2BNI3_9FIRM|nr:choice-of-anchor I family protein [Candidatus Erysipelatoclostridium merdavium]